jgi:hypothetical protein
MTSRGNVSSFVGLTLLMRPPTGVNPDPCRSSHYGAQLPFSVAPVETIHAGPGRPKPFRRRLRDAGRIPPAEGTRKPAPRSGRAGPALRSRGLCPAPSRRVSSTSDRSYAATGREPDGRVPEEPRPPSPEPPRHDRTHVDRRVRRVHERTRPTTRVRRDSPPPRLEVVRPKRKVSLSVRSPNDALARTGCARFPFNNFKRF